MRFAILELQHRGGIARAHPVGNRPVLAGHLVPKGAHLEVHLDHDPAVHMDVRLHFELEPDVEVLDRIGDDRRGGAGRDHRGDHRNAVADKDFRLFAVTHPHTRIGQQVAHARFAFQVKHGDGVADDATAVERELILKLHPELLQARTKNFQHLDLQHHLGFGVVLHGNEVLCQADDIGRIADHQQIEFLVDESVLGLEHGLDHVLRLLHIGVFEIKTAYDQVLVLARLDRRGRVHQHGVLVENLAGKLVGVEQQRDRILDEHILDRNADADIRAHILVKNEIKAAALGKRVKHLAQPDIPELQADRHRVTRLDLRRGNHLAKAPRLDLAPRLARLALLGVFDQHLVEKVERQLHLAFCLCGDRPLHLGTVPARSQHPFEAGQGARIARAERQHAVETLVGDILASGGKVGISDGEQLENGFFTLFQEPCAQGKIPRIGAHRFAHTLQPALHVSLRHEVAPLERKTFSRTTEKDKHNGRRQQWRGGLE